MKKMVFGVLAFIVTLTVAGGIQQYSSKPDIVGQQAKTVEQVYNLLSNRKGVFNICSSKFYKT